MEERRKNKGFPFDIKTLVIGGIFSLVVIFFQLYEQKKVLDTQAKDAGIILTNKIKAKMEVLEDVTDFLKGVSIARNGEVSKEIFYKVSKFLYSLYQDNEIRGIFYLKGGKVEYAYPIEGNIGTLGINILERADRKEEALLAIEKKQTVLSGPYDLYQGKKGLVIRNPIFVLENNKENFIGFSVVVIKFPSFINNIVANELVSYNYEISTYLGSEKKIIANKGKISEIAKSFDVEILNSKWKITLEQIVGLKEKKIIILVGGSLILLTLLLSNLNYHYKEKKLLLEEIEIDRKLLTLALENSNIVVFIYNDETQKISFIHKKNFLEEYDGNNEITTKILEDNLTIEDGKDELLRMFSQIKGGKKRVSCIVKKRSKKYGEIWEKITLVNPFVDKYGMRKIIGIVENITLLKGENIDDK